MTSATFGPLWRWNTAILPKDNRKNKRQESFLSLVLSIMNKNEYFVLTKMTSLNKIQQYLSRNCPLMTCVTAKNVL